MTEAIVEFFQLRYAQRLSDSLHNFADTRCGASGRDNRHERNARGQYACGYALLYRGVDNGDTASNVCRQASHRKDEAEQRV